MPLFGLGPPPRSFAADAYVASWSGSFEVHRIQVCGAIFRRLLASSPQIVRVYSRRIVKCTDSPSHGFPAGFREDQLMATQIVAWHALSPSSPRAARVGRATLRALGLDRLARPKQEAAMP